MENNLIYNNNNVNVNVDSNINCNIGMVFQAVRNKKDAMWFCMQNSNLDLIFRTLFS